MISNGFSVEPLTTSCREVWESRRHAVFGVSPGNSYFNVDRLRSTLDWLQTEFKQIDVVIPDSALKHTFTALGYDEAKAAKKARSETNVLRNRVLRAWTDLGGPRPADGLHRMSELSENLTYTEVLEHCTHLTAADPTLASASTEMTKEVLAAKGLTGDATPAQIAEAKNYLIAELPFFVSSCRIFEVDASLNFYHQPLPLANVIFSDAAALKPEPGQGYATIRPA
ncbi:MULTISPECIES: tRNA-dependent cyclodipeptide synthase [Amycolatopsis]|uniref:Cyclodipeptide synthase n=1 Tax=Amycolatopsis dendrobii TaxID=2760662 RepID=A0A7W3W498_9PSEU|nr:MULTISPECIES: tRNA-dependent cyclodipeptide synthase [Amycolatopsis]MBB1158581.1 tRNA-dependent cyclodipeptide synthase [Amycolatopsis dendrobii]UKD54466.1 tRNA-dependent cyclodipeptide synthase [Amycolatopsis sp. FU40]